jgi:hypothetical protein
LIPEELAPIRFVGRMVLNRNPDNFFAETEQVAFLPTNMPPGIDASDDPLLQGRLFSYLDTQLSRLGSVNFHQIPINRSKGCPFQNLQRDGHMQMQTLVGRANYEPNSFRKRKKKVVRVKIQSEAQSAIERRNAMEFFRDEASAQYERHTGSLWRPRTGSKVNHRALTSAMIDSRDYLSAKRRAENEVTLPPGPRIALTGGSDYNDHSLIWEKLDKVHARHADMVLLHGGTSTGAELIAARWAEGRKVPQIAFRPDWKRHAKAAPFKRNDAMLATLPIGVMVFPGTGIQDNLGDKARILGIPVWRPARNGA